MIQYAWNSRVKGDVDDDEKEEEDNDDADDDHDDGGEMEEEENKALIKQLLQLLKCALHNEM